MTTAFTPYQQLLADKARGVGPKPATPGRKPLSPYQRDERKIANNIAQRRAADVLKAKYADEFKALAASERAALYAAIDAEFAANPNEPRDVKTIAREQEQALRVAPEGQA